MSLEIGMAALRLEMPERVARTEYSFLEHWDLIEAETGLHVDPSTDPQKRLRAQQALLGRWKYDFHWSTLVDGWNYLPGRRTDMGHADYAAGGIDRRELGVCPFSDPEEFYDLNFEAEYGRHEHADLVRAFQDHYSTNCAQMPDAVCMTGTYISCVSGLIDILGWEMLLLAVGMDAKRFGEATERYGKWMMQYYEALADSEVPVVMIHDDIVWSQGPFLHPDWYRRFVFPNYRKYLAPLREAGKIVMFTSDGDFSVFIDDIAECGFSGFVFEPYTDIAAIAERYGQTHAFIGNVDTRVLLSGTREQIRCEVVRCMDIGKPCPGFFLAVGNHIPANTPAENARYYNECYEELSRR